MQRKWKKCDIIELLGGEQMTVWQAYALGRIHIMGSTAYEDSPEDRGYGQAWKLYSATANALKLRGSGWLVREPRRERGGGDYCGECGEWMLDSQLYGGRCGKCHCETVGSSAGTIQAGENLPLREVFSGEEIARLLFARHLMTIGILNETSVREEQAR